MSNPTTADWVDDPTATSGKPTTPKMTATPTTSRAPRFCVCRHGIGAHGLRGCAALNCLCLRYTAKPTRIYSGTTPEGEPPTSVLIAEHLEEHFLDAAYGPVETAPGPELTDELAEVLAAVADGTLNLTVPAAGPDDTAMDQYRRRHAEEKRDKVKAALSLLAHLGYVNPILDGTWTIEPAGSDALAARQAAAEAAARRKVADAYQALAAELRAIADAIAAVSTDGLVELIVDLTIRTTYAARGEQDPAKVATVDTIAGALLGAAGVTRQLNTSATWMHEAEGRRGPVKVEVNAFIDDPTAREREAAEQARVAEVERLRAELADLRAAAHIDNSTLTRRPVGRHLAGSRVQIQDRDREPDWYEWATVVRAETHPDGKGGDGYDRPGYVVRYDHGTGEVWIREYDVLAPRGIDPRAAEPDDDARERALDEVLDADERDGIRR